jgi:phage terminase large subunit-like protein
MSAAQPPPRSSRLPTQSIGRRPGPKGQVTVPPLDLRKLPKGGGSRAIAFGERYLRVPKGTGALRRLRFRTWQRTILHGVLDEPRPRQGLVSMPAGNGKTTGFAAPLGLYGLLADGVEGAQVIVVASDQRQARITQNIARRMVELDVDLADRVQVFKDHLYVPQTDSVLMALPAEAAALEGWDPSLAILDELHVVTTDVYEAVTARAGKRARSLVLAISTPPRDGNTDSVMWRLVEHGREGLDPTFYLAEFAAPPGCDLDDEDAWHIANPALGDFLYLDALRSNRRTMRESSFRAYRLGQWPQVIDNAWLPPAAWDACAVPMASGAEGAEVVLGFDGSFSGDCTALVAVTIGDRPHVELVNLWEAPEGARDWRVPILEVEEAIRQACRRYRVRAIVADPYRWQRSLELLDGEGLPVEEFPQSPQRMTPATSRFYEAVVNGALSHSGDPRLARHLSNAVLKEDPRGARLAKEHKHSKRRIDAAVAAVMALHRASEMAAQPGVQIYV